MVKDQSKTSLSSLVDGYNSMYTDPKGYAETTYKSNLKTVGRAAGRENNPSTSTLDKTVKKWPMDHIPG